MNEAEVRGPSLGGIHMEVAIMPHALYANGHSMFPMIVIPGLYTENVGEKYVLRMLMAFVCPFLAIFRVFG